MRYGDRIQETTTTTGTGTITVGGAVTQFQTFASRVQVGDPCEYLILDGNGTAFEIGEGTLASSSTISRDTIFQSSNSDAAISLSAGTHKVFLTFAANSINKAMLLGDVFIDHVVSGLVLPSSGSITGASMSAGIAYVVGQRVKKGAQAHTYTASKDNYVDLSNTGVLTYPTAVTIGAAAPALTANSIRLGFVTTGASTITSATITGKDSLGNWMRNLVNQPKCSLELPSSSGITANTGRTKLSFASSANEIFDNTNMHSTSVNPTRVTILAAGWHRVIGTVQMTALANAQTIYTQVLLNNAVKNQSSNQADAATYPEGQAVWEGYCAINDYLEASVETGFNETIYAGSLIVSRG